MASLSSGAAERPKPERQTTGDVLSYYFQDSSEPEPETAPAPQRRKSSSSRSRPSPEMPSSTNNTAATKVHRRRSSRTENAGDRRRIAIMEMDGPPLPTTDTAAVDDGAGPDVPTSQLLARRGLDQARLALVAPPDAAPISYSSLSPPPPVSAPPQPSDLSRKQQESAHTQHQRSRSTIEGVRSHNPSRSFSSRDIGIVGTTWSAGRTPAGDERSPKMLSLENPRPVPASDVLSTPAEEPVALIFQTPPSRTPSPDLVADTPHPGLQPSLPPWAATDTAIITPDIGQGKELDAPVAPPVVTMLSDTARLHLNIQAPGIGTDMYNGASSPSSGSNYEPTPHQDTIPRGDLLSRAASQHASPSGSNVSSPSSEYSSQSSRGGTYYPLASQQYQSTSMSGRAEANRDHIRGPPPESLEPVRAVPLPSLTPPPRPPRLKTPHSSARRAEAKALEEANQATPTQAAAFAQPLLDTSESHSPNKTPTAKVHVTSVPPTSATDARSPQTLLFRQMSDFSITAVTVSSSASDEDHFRASTGPTSEAVAPSLGSTPSLRQPLGSAESSDSKPAREGLQSFPPSAFRRDVSPDNPKPRSSNSSPAKRQASSDHLSPRKTSEETRLEEMLESMSPLLMAVSKSPPRPSPSPLPVLRDHSDAESASGISTGISVSSPILPDLASQRSGQGLESRSPSLQDPATPETVPSPIKAEVASDAQRDGSISSMDGSFVHASRPQSPILESMQPVQFPSTRRPSLSLAVGAAGKRSSAERSPSISSSIGKFAVRAQFRGAAMYSPRTQRGRLQARAITTMPDAMGFDDVLRCKTSLDRAQGYARKINELARVDSGLTQWMLAVKHRAHTPGNGRQVDPNLLGVGGQPRKVSSSSQGSEFPTRPDATVATEIPVGDSPPRGVPVSIPYPVLAQGMGVRSSSTRSFNSSAVSLASSSSIAGVPQNVKRPGGFFSTIGRKSSIRRDRTLPLPNPNPLSRQTSALAGQVLMPESPSRATRPPLPPPTIPGGPRDLPGRPQTLVDLSRRSSADATTMPQPLPSPATPDKRRSVGPGSNTPMYIRPTDALKRASRMPLYENGSNPNFEAGLQRMADILPHVDRALLSVYLEDAGGEDIVAITRYVDDEKRGTLKGS